MVFCLFFLISYLGVSDELFTYNHGFLYIPIDLLYTRKYSLYLTHKTYQIHMNVIRNNLPLKSSSNF